MSVEPQEMIQPARRPLLLGESNPYGSNPKYALYPEPERSAGGRLCRVILGLEVRDYLRRYERRNLCAGQWSVREARAAALGVRESMEAWADACPRGQSVAVAVLLGSKVCGAFGLEFRPFIVMAMTGRWRAVILPHPSGLCRLWRTEPDAIERARAVTREAAAL